MKKLIKDINKQVYRTKIGRDNDDIVIGDENSSLFKPQFKMYRWNKENYLEFRYSKNNFQSPTFSNGKIKVKNAKEELELCKEGNNFKFIITLTKKPQSNIFTFYLDGWNEFNFFYQPPLTDEISIGEYKGQNIVTVTETEAITDTGMVMVSRPDYVVGSYAVYHKKKRDHWIGKTNYKVGKAWHIYRPKWVDADGKWVWADIHIDNGVYTNTCPQSFIDTAKYPIRTNDNFGTEGEGGSTDSNANYPEWHLATSTPDNDGTLTSISLYVKQSQEQLEALCPALYSNDAADTTPDVRLAYLDTGGTAIPSTTLSWVTTNLSYGSITSGVQYWLGEKSGTNGDFYTFAMDTGGSKLRWRGYQEGWSDPAGDNAGNTNTVSIYATYTPYVEATGQVISVV